MSLLKKPVPAKPTIEDHLQSANSQYRSAHAQVAAALDALDAAADAHNGVMVEASEQIARLADMQMEARDAKRDANALASNIRQAQPRE